MTRTASPAATERSRSTAESCGATCRTSPPKWSRCGLASSGTRSKPGTCEPGRAVPALSILAVDEVVKHYADAGELVRAVDGVTLAIVPGRVYVLYGPSGSGKTTLLLLVAGLIAPDRGVVR